MKNFKNIFFTFFLAVVACYGQASMASTTLGAAITTTGQTRITLASTSTMLNPGPANQINTVLYVDKEYMWVQSVVNSTTVIVNRAKGVGAAAKATTHANGAKVWFAITTTSGPAPSYFTAGSLYTEPSGSCTATQLLVVPVIYLFSGNMYTCLGSQWIQTNAPGLLTLGSTVASPAGVMTATGTIFHVSGTNAVTGLNVPAGFAPGMSLYLIPDAAFTTTTATNISLASTAVANKTLIMTWDGVKWNPSY